MVSECPAVVSGAVVAHEDASADFDGAHSLAAAMAASRDARIRRSAYSVHQARAAWKVHGCPLSDLAGHAHAARVAASVRAGWAQVCDAISCQGFQAKSLSASWVPEYSHVEVCLDHSGYGSRESHQLAMSAAEQAMRRLVPSDIPALVMMWVSQHNR